PLDQHGFAVDLAWGLDRRRRRVPVDFQTGKVRVVRNGRSRHLRVFKMNGVEAAVLRVVWIELKADETARKSQRDRQLVEEAGLRSAAVEIQVDAELLRFLVEDVERSVQVVHEEPPRASRLLAHEV